MIPAELNLEDHKRGDGWDGLQIGPFSEDGENLQSACVSCRIHFRHPSTKILGHALSSTPTGSEGTITITDAATYEFNVPKQFLPLPVGTWTWEFETIDAAGFPATWIYGKIAVVEDVAYG